MCGATTSQVSEVSRGPEEASPDANLGSAKQPILFRLLLRANAASR